MDPDSHLDMEEIQWERMVVPIRRDIRAYAACWARVLSCAVPGLGHIFIGSLGFGLVYAAVFAAAVSTVVINRHGAWWPGLLAAVAVWAISLGHIHAQTKEY